jgi:hypothetical protein
LLYPLVTAGEHDRGVRVSKVSADRLEIVELVRTGRTGTASVPVQALLNPDEPGVIEIYQPSVGGSAGLAGLAGFDYARSPTSPCHRV